MDPAPPGGIAPTAAELLLRAINAEGPKQNPYEWAAAQARAVSVARPRYLQQQLAEDAFEYLEDAVHRYDPARPLEPWARTVLWRRLMDLYNGRLRTRPLTADTADLHREPSGDEWVEAFQRVSESLAAADFYPTPGGPDHYAAFVFDLRLRIGKRIGCGDEADPVPLPTTAGWLPWPAWFGPRRFLPGWPRVADIWAEAERRARIPARTPPVTFIGECVATVAPEVPWKPVTWRKWVERGEEGVRKLIPADVWRRYFQNLFIERTANPEGDQ